jgi:hypothetical protein
MSIYSELILCVCTVSMVTELIPAVRKQGHMLLMRWCILVVGVCLMIPRLVGLDAAQVIGSYIRIDSDNWIITVLVVAGYAGLMLAENWKSVTNTTYTGIAWAMLGWVALVAIMKVWDVMLNLNILYFWYPVFYGVAYIFSQTMNKKLDQSSDRLFIIGGGVLFAALLLLTKSYRLGILTGPALLIVLTGGCIFLYAMSKNKLKQTFTVSLSGIAAVLLLCSARFDSVEALAENPALVLAAIGMCILWPVICSRIGRMDEKASELYQTEFCNVRKLTGLVPVAGLVVMAVRVLLFM